MANDATQVSAPARTAEDLRPTGIQGWIALLSVATKAVIGGAAWGLLTAFLDWVSWTVENDSGCHYINWGALSGAIVIVVSALFGFITVRNKDNDTVLNLGIIAAGLVIAVFLVLQGLGTIMSPCG